jgi:hypothetical protein
MRVYTLSIENTMIGTPHRKQSTVFIGRKAERRSKKK